MNSLKNYYIYVKPTYVVYLEFNQYKITVKFVAGCYGSFTQRLIFDFGDRPVLERTLKVDVNSRDVLETLKELKQELTLDVWTRYSNKIIPYSGAGDFTNQEFGQLLLDYPEPTQDVGSSLVTDKEITRENYTEQMHQVLYLEERQQSVLVSRCALCR